MIQELYSKPILSLKTQRPRIVFRKSFVCCKVKFFPPESRVRWILPLLIGFPLMCLAILGAYIAQGILKGKSFTQSN